MDWGELVVDADGTFEKGLVRIIYSRDQVFQSKTMRLVKVCGSTKESIILSYLKRNVCFSH